MKGSSRRKGDGNGMRKSGKTGVRRRMALIVLLVLLCLFGAVWAAGPAGAGPADVPEPAAAQSGTAQPEARRYAVRWQQDGTGRIRRRTVPAR